MLRVVAYSATRDLIPLYGVYTLLFSDHGLSAGQISSLLVIWSLTSFVAEVPSGVWADLVDRRRLLLLSAPVYAAGSAMWSVQPTYVGFAAGFVGWGLSGAMMSGTFEALVFDELAARGAPGAYAQVIGRARAAATAAELLATLAAVPLFAAGGHALVAWTSVGVIVVHGALAWSLPPAPVARAAADDTAAAVVGYWSMMRAGLAEATRHRSVRRTVAVTAALLGLTSYDEYLPLVARDHGVATHHVPLLLAAVGVGQLAGTALADRTAHLPPRAVAGMVAGSAALVAAGAIAGHPAGFVAITFGYGLVHNAVIVTEARLQAAIRGPARATVTSAAGLSAEVVVVALYGVVGTGSALVSVAVLVALVGLPMLGVAAAIGRWLPAATRGPGERSLPSTVDGLA